MSYARHLRTLIVEDEASVLDLYEDIFKTLPAHLPHDMFVRATCYEEAEARLAAPEPFHLVVFDLGLPLAKRANVEAHDVTPGVSLARLAAQREDYPVPACLVISGKINDTSIEHLNNLVRREFWFGAVETKFDPKAAVQKALEAAQRYCEVGIHIRDGGRTLCPTLTPREEDLLRRCILNCEGCVGVDLESWAGSFSGGSRALGDGSPVEPSKVLMGRFIMRDGRGFSRPNFFKFEPSSFAAASQANAKIFQQKLNHSRVVYALAAGNRSLLVTDKAGDSDKPPLSLREVLASPLCLQEGHLARVSIDIAGQLSRLGSVEESEWPISRVFRPFYDAETLRRGWDVCGGRPEDFETLRSTWLTLSQSPRREWMRKSVCTHGDLNASNLALDENTDGGWHAYIIDAGSLQSDLAVRDYAALEVSLLLHQPLVDGDRPLNLAEAMLYGADIHPAESSLASLSKALRPTFSLISELRLHAVGKAAPWLNEPLVFALAVFDAALMQLSGFAHQVRGNKVIRPSDATLLTRCTAAWVRGLTPELFASS